MEGWDLMSELLLYDPERRITAREALAHPYFFTSKPNTDAADEKGNLVNLA